MGYGDDLLITAFAAKIKKKYPERQIVIGNAKEGTAFYSRKLYATSHCIYC